MYAHAGMHTCVRAHTHTYTHTHTRSQADSQSMSAHTDHSLKLSMPLCDMNKSNFSIFWKHRHYQISRTKFKKTNKPEHIFIQILLKICRQKGKFDVTIQFPFHVNNRREIHNLPGFAQFLSSHTLYRLSKLHRQFFHAFSGKHMSGLYILFAMWFPVLWTVLIMRKNRASKL